MGKQSKGTKPNELKMQTEKLLDGRVRVTFELTCAEMTQPVADALKAFIDRQLIGAPSKPTAKGEPSRRKRSR